MTGTELDDILADTTQEQEQQVETTDGPTRDEQGRFAAKAEMQPVQTAQVEQQAETDTGKVPQQALHASREKEREARQEADALRTQLAELRGQVQMLSQRPAQPAPKPEPEKAPEFWEDPSAYVNHALGPVQQQMQQQREQFSKMLAMQAHGKETVDNAFKAFVEAAQANPGAYAGEYQAMMKSEHPYDSLVAWHKRQQTLQTVGSDPNAWLEAELEKRLADPAYQAKVMERIRGTAATTTDRANPVTKLPPSLSRLPAGGNAPGETDLSDAGLFANALR